MSKFVASVFLILLSVVIGGTLFNGNTNSVRASMEDVITQTNTELVDIAD